MLSNVRATNSKRKAVTDMKYQSRLTSFRHTNCLPRAIAGTSPSIAQSDVNNMITMRNIVLRGFERVEVPVVAISNIDKGLVRNEKFHSAIRSKSPGDTPVFPDDPALDPKIRHDNFGNSEIVLQERRSRGLP